MIYYHNGNTGFYMGFTVGENNPPAPPVTVQHAGPSFDDLVGAGDRRRAFVRVAKWVPAFAGTAVGVASV
jgi:hypothetical protein